jgi:hypothetical protein
MIGPVPADVARTSARAKGFELKDNERTKKKDHELWILRVDGRWREWFVKISHGSGVVIRIDDIQNSVRKFGITGHEFHGILSCRIGPEETIALYRKTKPDANDDSCPSCREEIEEDDRTTDDEEGRIWHLDCVIEALRPFPYNYPPTLCPGCGAETANDIVSVDKRRWHGRCAARELAQR